MDEVDFYLEDLKSKFEKINPKEYYFFYFEENDKFLYWFIKNELKDNEIEIISSSQKEENILDKKAIYGFYATTMETCFDKDGNFFPLHDLTPELKEKIIEKYEIHGK